MIHMFLQTARACPLLAWTVAPRDDPQYAAVVAETQKQAPAAKPQRAVSDHNLTSPQ